MKNEEIIEQILENTTWILRQEKTKKVDVWEQLYPLLLYTERLKDVIEAISKLIDRDGKVHPTWMLLMRSIMLDGVLIIYAYSERKRGEELKSVMYDMLADGLKRIEKHASRQKEWNIISEDEKIEAIKEFKAKFSTFYDKNGELVYRKEMPAPHCLVGEIKGNNIFLFNIAQDFYTKYFILSKFEHYNILSKEIREILELDHYLKMAFIHMVYLSDLILGIDGSLTPKERVEELIRLGRIIKPNCIP